MLNKKGIYAYLRDDIVQADKLWKVSEAMEDDGDETKYNWLA